MADDEVIKEIDVFLSKSLADNLFIFQYPTRPAGRQYDEKNVIRARIKPEQKKVEIETRIPKSRHCNKSKAEQIALNVDGAGADYSSGQTYFDSPRMDKNVFASSPVALSSGCYAIGLLREGRLHLTPITSVLQLRPSFAYEDKSFSMGQMEGRDDDSEQQEEPQAVTVKFAGPNAERAKKAREKSYRYIQRRLESEPWSKAVFHAQGSQRSKLEIERLLCTRREGEATNTSLPPKDYLQALVPPVLLQSQESKGNQKVESVFDMKSLSIADCLRAIMINAQVLKFEQISELMAVSQEQLEKYLQQISVLVQGCWVVKSDVLYGKDSTSPHTGINADLLIRARDYILWCFSKSRYLTRSDVLSVMKVPEEDVTALLTQVAKKVYNKGWEFKYPFDQEFMENHPNVVQRQAMLWDVRYKQLVRDLRLGQMASADTSPRMSFPPPPSPKERRHFKYRESFSDDAEDMETSNEKADSDYLSFRKIRLFKKSAMNRKRSASSPSKNGPKSHIFNSFDVPPTFLPSLHSPEMKSELLNHVRDILFEKFCLTVQELRDTLTDVPLNQIAEREDCLDLLEETLLEVGAQRLKNKWPHNTQPVPLFAYTKFGTSLDRYRNALLDLYTNTARSRPNYLVKKIEDENGEIISESACKQIFEEYCIYKSGFYYLKGTISPDS